MDSLVKIDGKPIEKLIEVISNAIGTLYEPRQLVRIARAEAEAERIKAIEGAKTKALLANDEGRYAELTAIEKRVVAKELKRQNNINNVVTIASQSLKEEKEVSSEPVNPDWATRFFDIAQDISDETMQDLWGRILAGEVKQPQSYSLRTLDVLRNITSEEAQLFEEIANYTLYSGNYFIFNGASNKLEHFGIAYYKIAQLIEAGLIQSGSTVSHHFYVQNGQTTTHYMSYGNLLIKIEQPISMADLSLPIYILSTMGREIYQLLKSEPNYEYLSLIAQYIKKKDKDLKVFYTPILEIEPNGDIQYDNDAFVEL